MSNDTTTAVPSLDEVEEWAARAAQVRDRREWVRSRLRELSAGLGSLLAEGRGEAPEAEALREERGSLRDELEELDAALPELERLIADGRDRALREAARDRLKQIARARGGLTETYDKDVGRVEEAAQAFIRTVEQANERYERLLGLESESEALAGRFHLPRTPQERAHPPANRDDVREALAIVDRVGLRKRVLADQRASAPADSPGRKLLELAGPTEAEREARAENDAKERERRKVEESLRAAQDRGSVPGRAAALGG